jgi:hypothetical protein
MHVLRQPSSECVFKRAENLRNQMELVVKIHRLSTKLKYLLNALARFIQDETSFFFLVPAMTFIIFNRALLSPFIRRNKVADLFNNQVIMLSKP